MLEALGLLAPTGRRARRRAPEDPFERDVLAAICDGDGSVDALVGATGANAAAILSTLAILEIDGRVESRGGGTYATLETL
ncbi:MAG: hypothetical protein M3R30_07340 [Candidatus Eremiobacteraeota bacterium]|nr:hypothetical protein [Candidatus Eremiobacteraeota bacterium]